MITLLIHKVIRSNNIVILLPIGIGVSISVSIGGNDVTAGFAALRQRSDSAFTLDGGMATTAHTPRCSRVDLLPLSLDGTGIWSSAVRNGDVDVVSVF